MLVIYTSTYARPDLVDLMSQAVKKTCTEPCRVIVQIQPGGLKRDWKSVDEIIYTDKLGRFAWNCINRNNYKSLIIDEDCIPLFSWSSLSFPQMPCVRKDGGMTLIYSDGSNSPILPILPFKRVHSAETCSVSWGTLCDLAIKCKVESLLDDTFLHIDKGTLSHPILSPLATYKRQLVEAIAKYLDIIPPEPLNPNELSVHPGVTHI